MQTPTNQPEAKPDTTSVRDAAWPRVRRIVEVALDAGSLIEQEDVVRREAQGDNALAARALAILQAERRSEMLERTSAGEHLSRAMLEQTPPAMVGAVLGKYRLRTLIGVGGMGAVYEAHDDLLDRDVALKIIHPAIATPALVQRFSRECKTLAKVQHPGVARVYEAGQLELGPEQMGTWPLPARLPYLAMELVREGQPLTRSTIVAQMGLRDKVRLFAKICDAVHAAHQQGVIHRDLKPDNILVGADAAPKVIDFGIALLLDEHAGTSAGRITRSSIHAAGAGSQTGSAVLGTMRYLSPEQLASPLAGDVRSDIYALGITVYEMLCGVSPYASLRTGTGASSAKLARDIEEHQVRGVVLAGTDQASWPRAADLAAVVTKAMAHAPADRYQSAADLARDLQHLLSDQPILARPIGRLDEIRLFARRNRTLVAASLLVFLSVLAGVVGTTTSLLRARAAQRQAELEATRATRIAQFFQRTLQSASVENHAWNRLASTQPGEVSLTRPVYAWLNPAADWSTANPDGTAGAMVDILLAAARHLDESLKDGDPGLHASLACELGAMLTSMARFAEGDALLRSAQTIWTQRNDTRNLVRVLTLRLSAVEQEEVPAIVAQLEPLALELFGPLDEHMVYIVSQSISRQWPEAQLPAMLEKGRALSAALEAKHHDPAAKDSPPSLEQYSLRSAEVSLLLRMGRGDEAYEVAQRAYAQAKAQLGEVQAGALLGFALTSATPADRASLARFEQNARLWLDASERVLGPGHIGCYEARSQLVSALARQGKFAEALPLVDRTFQLARRTMGERSIYTTKARGLSARCMSATATELREASERARSASEDILLEDPIGTDWWFYYQTILASATRQRGQPDDALAILQAALAPRRALRQDFQSPWADTFAQTELGLTLLELGDHAGALAALVRARDYARLQNEPTSGFRFDRAILATRLGVPLDPAWDELPPAGGMQQPAAPSTEPTPKSR